jgi:hypothetical protein
LKKPLGVSFDPGYFFIPYYPKKQLKNCHGFKFRLKSILAKELNISFNRLIAGRALSGSEIKNENRI